ncbi:uncharacterized protein LOC107270815 [Cephus cinctus]|uniref:Uncharacterized protein LOC107270815 n=1 Tax=Cephus cinctus TaxID=211228 RepID=A0AAJ7FPB7_CEPCN|nr:uncharacterized protein LOC107270815 [Cephus cinctus]
MYLDMAEIANSSVFTNGVVSSGTSDLLQRAFQQVVDEEDNENDFVAFLQTDSNESQTIHLTQAQAAALGLTFEVDSSEEATEEISYQQEQTGMYCDLQQDLDAHDVNEVKEGDSSPTSNTINIDHISFQSNLEHNNGIKHVQKSESISFQDWPTQDGIQEESLVEESINQDISMEEMEVCNAENSVQDRILKQSNNIGQKNINSQTFLAQEKGNTIGLEEAQVVNTTENNIQYSFEGNQIQAAQLGSIPNSQAQILQRLPVILSSSQFILKPPQTLLKPAKNIRILPNTSKITNSTINTVHSINNSSQNSILLPKTTLLNTLSPQIIKATPITQLLNTNNISAQLLNTSQILAGDISNPVINTSHISASAVNGTPMSTQNVLNSQIRLSPAVKSSQASIQRGNVQQFLTPILKNTSNTSQTIKTSQILTNANLKTAISTPFLKSVQIPAQMLRSSASTIKGTNATSTLLTKTTANTSSPVVFRTASIVKSQDLKTATTCSASTLRPTQMISSPISILKPQAKVAFSNSTKQNLMLNSQNVVSSISSNLHTPTTAQTPVVNPSNDFDCIKPPQNGTVKQKSTVPVNCTAVKIGKKAKIVPTQKPTAVTTEKNDTTKPLGSSENPIQIVQQGHMFHSMQRLTQSQLKQITHVLQQRSQEVTMPNERIVYRVVFPEELDLRTRTPGTLLKGRGGKRGRPKKNAVRPPTLPSKSTTLPEDDQEEIKDERKKVVARTRSGRLSRPPRHMVRDYKHLHHLDFMQPDLDDSDGGYSDYNTNSDKLEDEESPKELLTGLEVPKRKISDHFRCPTCNKIYLGRTRMARHFEMHPDHGSPEQLPPPTLEPELKQTPAQDPLKRKGKKRGPWAYVTPEAKSERRQVKLKEAISVCENLEIIKIAAKPVLNAKSLFELLILKSDNNVRTFLDELKELMNKIREKAGAMLTVVRDVDKPDKDVINLTEELLCDALGLNPGRYKINNGALKKEEETVTASIEEPPLKLQKVENSEEGKENIDERLSSGFSESSDLSVSEFLTERKTDSGVSSNCPEVLTALTLMPRNPSQVNNNENSKSSSHISKLLISSPSIQNKLTDSSGFQKIDMNSSKVGENIENASCSQVFDKLDSFGQEKLEPLEQAFIKLERMDHDFVKIENGTIGIYEKQNSQSFNKIQNNFDNIENGSQNFTKGFQKLVSKTVSISCSDLTGAKTEGMSLENSSSKLLSTTAICKISDSLPILQDTVPIISSGCDSSIFGSTENLDISKISNYDHITHLDILNTSGVIDKNLLIDEKLVEQLHLVDQTNLVDELVSERLKNIMPDNILENSLMPNNSNLDTDLDFEALSEEFNRNTRS